jgi:transposase
MAKKKLSEEQEKEAVVMYETGSSAQQIAGHFNVHPVTMRMTLLRHGVKSRGMGGAHRVEVAPHVLEKMLIHYNAGESCQWIADRFGLGRTTVGRLLEAAGVKLRYQQLGEKHGNWKGGRRIQDGHVLIRIYPDDPFYSMASNGYVLEHRLVMAKKLGRLLRDEETVHHKDGNGLHNKYRNLQLRQGKHGKGAAFRCADCGSCNVTPVPLAGEGAS